MDRYKIIFEEVVREIDRARKKHKPYNSHHEAYAVMLEEVEEYWDSIKVNRPNPCELVQVAAVAMMALNDLYGE